MRKLNIHHYWKSDDFSAGFKVAKWEPFCHLAWLQISPARFKQVYSDKILLTDTAIRGPVYGRRSRPPAIVTRPRFYSVMIPPAVTLNLEG